MRCDGCKYWNLKEGHTPNPNPDWPREEDVRPTVGLCEKAQPYWETTEWRPRDQGGPVRVSKPEFEGLKMFVQDGSDYVATLLTTADFFCAHHEPR